MGRLSDEVLGDLIAMQSRVIIIADGNDKDLIEYTENILKFLKELQEYRSICDSPEKLKLIDDLYLERCEEINRLKAELAEKEEEFCEWKLWDEEMNCYETHCENAHILLDGSIKDNCYVFCPYCGRKIKEV